MGLLEDMLAGGSETDTDPMGQLVVDMVLGKGEATVDPKSSLLNKILMGLSSASGLVGGGAKGALNVSIGLKGNPKAGKDVLENLYKMSNFNPHTQSAVPDILSKDVFMNDWIMSALANSVTRLKSSGLGGFRKAIMPIQGEGGKLDAQGTVDLLQWLDKVGATNEKVLGKIPANAMSYTGKSPVAARAREIDPTLFERLQRIIEMTKE